MDFPFGSHHHHHHHHRRDDDEPRPPPPPQPCYGGLYPQPLPEPYPPPPTYGGAYHHPPLESYPPPSYGGSHPYPPPESYPPPPQPQVTGVYHSSSHNRDYPPPPGSASYVHRTSRDEGPHHHHFRPHMPAFIEGHFHTHDEVGPHNLSNFLANKPSSRFYCKAGGDHYSVAIRDGKVVLTRYNRSDPTQHWIKDERYSTKVKDEEGHPSFALINKATGQAVKHSIGGGYPVQLIPYKPDVFDESILWTESKDLGHGYRSIRMVNNIRLSMDAFHGDKDHGGVHDGTTVVLYESWKGDNQQWKIVPY